MLPSQPRILSYVSPCAECCEGYSNRLLITRLLNISMLLWLPLKAENHQSAVMATWDRLKIIQMLWPIQGYADATLVDFMARGVC